MAKSEHVVSATLAQLYSQGSTSIAEKVGAILLVLVNILNTARNAVVLNLEV